MASGEAALLAWSPPSGAEKVQPHADAQTLVRFLGGLKDFDASSENATAGDVVVRGADGTLEGIRWDLVFERLDPFVNNSISPIIMLDNVPWAFAKPSAGSAAYGNNMGPENLTEFAGFVRALARGISARYGTDGTGLAFRVGTEPNTQPNHWNDTNDAYGGVTHTRAAAPCGGYARRPRRPLLTPSTSVPGTSPCTLR